MTKKYSWWIKVQFYFLAWISVNLQLIVNKIIQKQSKIIGISPKVGEEATTFWSGDFTVTDYPREGEKVKWLQ
jgi:hypothetical protein